MLLAITLLMTTLMVGSAYMVAPASAQVDDWPMFMHDPVHSGYSTSSAPAPFIVGWKFKTGEQVRGSAAVVAGKVYIGSDDFFLYCLDADTGSQVWRYETMHHVSSSPAVDAGKVYFGSFDTYIYCLDAAGGSLVWKVKTGGPVQSSPCVVAGRVYIASNDGYLYCLDAADGSEVWKGDISTYEFKSLVGRSMTNYFSSPAVADGKVYIGSFDRRLYCFDTATGSQVWNATTGGGIYASSPSVAYGYVYVGSDDFWWYWFDAENGTQMFRYMNPERISTTWLETTTGFHNEKLYVGYPHALSKFDVTTKDLLWAGRTGSAQKSSPAIADGKVYIGGQDSYFWCYDDNTGEQIQNMGRFAGAITSGPAIYNGKIYFGCWDHYVYCCVAGTPTAISCWADPISPTIGDSVYVRGAITPAVSGATVTLTYLKPDATTLIRTTTSGTDGTYEDSYTPDLEGHYSVKAGWPGDATHGAALSTAVAFVSPAIFNVMPVKMGTSSISCWLGWTAPLPLGETQYTRGGITPAVSTTVTLTYTKPDATTLTRTVTSGTDGSYEDPYTPDAKGYWSVKASWAGSAAVTGAASMPEVFSVIEEAAPPAEEGIPIEYIYVIVAVIAIIIVAIAAYWILKR
jgi:outer membrane protein assembly factor BamB